MLLTLCFIFRTSNCDEYFALIDTFAFEPVTREEQKFPLAFSFQAHKHIGVMEMFLALYFRPTDSYCIHVDEKAGKKVKQAVNAVVG